MPMYRPSWRARSLLKTRSFRCSFAVLAVIAALAIPSAAALAETSTPSWQPIAPAPIPGRISEGVVWTGRRMIVWGGISRTGTIEMRRDGAVFDPGSERWRSIAPAPRGVIGGGGQAAAWTGRRAVFWAGNSPDGPAGGAVYNPRTDHWRSLPRGPLGPREGYVSAWTGRELIVIGGTLGDGLATPVAAAVDPRAGRWRRLPALNHLDGVDGLRPSGVVWSGDRLFVAGAAYDCSDDPCTSRPIFLTYDIAADDVEEIDLSNTPSPSLTPIAWTGTDVFATGHDAVSIVLYDPSTDTWRTGAAAACAAETSPYRQTAWLDGRYVATCGFRALQIYDVTADAWEKVRSGRSPFNSRAGSAIVWTGRVLVVWSGIVERTGNPTPRTGMSIRI